MANRGDTATSKSGKPIWFDGTNWMYGSPPDIAHHAADANQDGNVSWGEDVGASIQSGLRRGVAGVAGLPGAIRNTMDDAAVKIGLLSPEAAAQNRAMGFPEMQQAVNKGWNAANDVMGTPNHDTGYEPSTRSGRFAQTGSEFFVGAPLTGPSGQLSKTLAPTMASAVGSEGAGQLAEVVAPDNKVAEAAARVAGAVAAPWAANKVLKPLTQPRATQAHRDAVAALEADGVTPTGAQVADDPKALSREAFSPQGPALLEQANDSFTKAAMRKAIDPRIAERIDWNMDLGNAEAVLDAMDQVRGLMDDLAQGNSLSTTRALLDDADDIAKAYGRQVGHYSKSPYLDNVVADLKKGGLSGEDYQIMRTTLRELAEGADGVTRRAASKMLTRLTDAMDEQLVQNGRGEMVDLYRGARKTFRDLKTLERAFGAAGAQASGNITPANLGASLKVREGAQSVMSDSKSTFSSLVRNGRKVLTQPKSSGTAENLRALAGQSGIAASPGALAGGAIAGPVGAVVGGITTAALPAVRNMWTGTKAGQRMLKQPVIRGMPMEIGRSRPPALPGSASRPWWEEDDKKR